MSMKTPPKNFQELQNYLYEMRTCLENLALNLTQEQREREAHLRQVQVQKAKESGVALPSGYESYERYYKDHPPFLLQRGLYDDQTLRSLSSLEKTFDETSRYLVEIKEDDTLNMVSQKLRKAQAIARDGDTISSDRQEIS